MTPTHDLDTPQATQASRSRVRAAVERLHPDLADVGTEPDPRFTFANERTFLAWARTGLALIGGGLLAAQVLHFGLGGGHLVLALPTIGLGGLLGIIGFKRWQANERAMRLGEPLGQAPLVPLLMVGIVAIAVISAVLVAIAALVN
ncbi:MAG: YidH family protein [Solirubrobacteraceae bacterium]